MFKRVIAFVFVIVIASFLFSFPVQAKKKSQTPIYVDQQMILMGLYLYGINQELTKKIPDLDEMQFLSESIIEIANQSQKAKRSKIFHNNMATLLKEAQKLRKVAKSRNFSQAKIQAKALVQSCAKCHRAGSF